MTQGSDTVAERLRALAATRWIDRSDEATREALLAGADEVERLAAELDFARRQREGDGDLIRRLYAEGGEYVDRLATAEALARGAQYREREARNEVAVLRARLDGVRSLVVTGDLAGLGRREGRTWTVTVGEGEGR